MTRPVITNIQFLRFLAAASVLITHSADLLIPHTSFIFRLPWVGGVDLFFVISGFIMAWLTWGRFGEAGLPGRFLLRRAIRIVPPYWFFTTVMVAAVVFASAHVRKTTLGAAQILTSYAFVPWPRVTDGKLNPLLSQGWTLNYEVFFYVTFAAALCFKKGLRWLVLTFLALATIHYAIPPEVFVLKFFTDPIILEFLAGIGIAGLYIRGVRVSRIGSLAVAASAVPVYLAMTVAPPFEGSRFLYLGLSAALLVASLALRPEATSAGGFRRFLRLGGDASYTLYLSHTFTVNLVAVAWGRYGHGSPWLGAAIAVLAATGIAILLYRYVERPLTERLTRLFGLSRPSEAQRVAP